MPIVVACTQCAKRFRVPDEFAGKRIKCPHCQAPQAVAASPPPKQPEAIEPPPEKPAAPPAPRPKRTAPPPPPPPPENSGNAFDFDGDPEPPEEEERPARRQRDQRDGDEEKDEREERAPRPSRLKRKSRWDDLASGMTAMQIGLIALLLAATTLVFGSRSLEITPIGDADRNFPDQLFGLLVIVIVVFSGLGNLLMGTVLSIVIASGIMGFGHISASAAPDPKANKRVTFSLILSGVSLLVWIAFLGIIIYIRVMIKELAFDKVNFFLLIKIWACCYSVGAAAAIGAELLFLSALKRAGDVMGVRRLKTLASLLFVFLFVGLALHVVASAALAVKTLFMGLEALTVIEWMFKILSKDNFPIMLGVYGGVVLFLVVYWILLQMAKWILRHPVEVREQRDEEDGDEEEIERPARRRSSRKDDDDDDD